MLEQSIRWRRHKNGDGLVGDSPSGHRYTLRLRRTERDYAVRAGSFIVGVGAPLAQAKDLAERYDRIVLPFLDGASFDELDAALGLPTGDAAETVRQHLNYRNEMRK